MLFLLQSPEKDDIIPCIDTIFRQAKERKHRINMKGLRQIADRVKEMREIMEIDTAYLAGKIGVSEDEYLAYENAEDDIPIGKLYLIADELGIDPTVLLIGDNPRMVDYTLVRAGKGISVERFAGYKFSSLAYNFVGREMEPMVVTLSPSGEMPEMVQHEGQEFNFALSGRVGVIIDGKEFELEPGDSIYFNPKLPHGQRAIGGDATFLTVINERMKGKI